MIVEPDFPDHWKTQMLIQLSQNEASPMWVLRLWAHCQQRKTHMFNNFPPEALKAVCRYVDQASKLESLLTTCGFARRQGSDFIVHQWDDYNAKLFANWENGKLGGRPKSEPKKKPNDNPTETHGLPNDNPQGTDREEKIDKIDKEEIHENEIIHDDISKYKQLEVTWSTSFKQVRGFHYKPTQKDSKGIVTLIKMPDYNLEYVISIAKKAWVVKDDKKAWWSFRHSKTLSGFSEHFTNIREEIESSIPKASKMPSSQELKS